MAARLIDRVCTALGEHLVALKLRKRAGAIYTTELAPDVIGWLGLNSATAHLAPGVVEVNPVVGVRHQQVERLVAELDGERFHEYLPPTVSTPLGYATPARHYVGWIVDTNRSDMQGEVSDLGSAIRDYGISFMRDHSHLGAICTLLDDETDSQGQAARRRPIAWLLAGDRKRALSSLQSSMHDLGERHDPAAEAFRRFAEAFQRWIESRHHADA